MQLRRRIGLAMLLIAGLTAAGGVTLLTTRTRLDRAQAASAALARQERAWHTLQAIQLAGLREGALGGQVLGLAPPAPPGPRLATDLGAGEGLVRIGEAVKLVALRPAPAEQDGALAVTLPLDSLLRQVAAATGAMPVLVDREGHPLAVPPDAVPPGAVSPGAGQLAGLLERLRQLDGSWREVAAGDRVVAVGTVPLTDRNGQAIGARRWITDVTEESWGRARDDLASALALVALVALATLAGLFWLRRAFRPLELVLAAQAALAEGDLTVELPRQDRADEIGGAVRALQVFRQGRIALRRRARADAWQRQVRLHFIEQQLGRLAATLDDGDRAAMEADLRALLAAAQAGAPGGGDAAGMDALAKAFRALAERVRSQHGKLRRLIADQGDALAARHRMERLEQELAAVARMQMRLVPLALPGETGAAVEGRLIQGSQFGGDFQDFFWLDGPGGRRLAVFAASVRGTGLDAAFLAISARALVRSLAPAMPTPGACLSRVSDLLLGDNEQRMEIGAFLGVVDLGAQVLVAARAAAPPPVLLLRPGEARALDVPAAPPLGLQPHLKVPDVTIDLPARAALVAFSHGVPDTALRGAPLGLHGVVELLAASPGLDPATVLEHAGARLTGGEATRPGDASLVVARLQSGA